MGDQAIPLAGEKPGCFPDGVGEASITQVDLLEQISEAGGHLENSSWCPCAWSPDCMYFAYSRGAVIQLVPWNRYRCCLLSKNNTTFDGHVLDLKPQTFNAGETVCSIALGSSRAETKPHSTQLNWYRYKHVEGLNLAVGTRSGQIRVWNLESVDAGCRPLVLMDHTKLVTDLKFAPDGSLRLLSSSYDGTLKVWHLNDDGNMFPTFSGSQFDGNKYRKMFGAAWAPNCEMICGVGTASGVFVWNVTTRKGQKFRAEGEIKGHHHDVRSCDFSPDGALLVTSSFDTKVIVWDPFTGDPLRQFLHLHPPPTIAFAGGANNSYVRSVSFSHDGRHIASACEDGYIRFWGLFSADVPKAITRIGSGVCCSYSPDGASLLVGSAVTGVAIVNVPMVVSSLRHYCRLALRRTLTRNQIESLFVGPNLQNYLQYVDFDSEAIPPLRERIRSLMSEKHQENVRENRINGIL